MTKKHLFGLAVCMCGALFLTCTTHLAGGTNTGNGHEDEVVGVLYGPLGTSVAVGAKVSMRQAGSLADTSGAISTDVATVKSGSDGRYAINGVDTGLYVIEATDSANNRALIKPVRIVRVDSTTALGPDTLKPAGAIKGKILLSEGGDPRKVLIFAFGLDRFTRVDSGGLFLFADLARETYTLRILPLMTDYAVLDTGGIQVLSAATTDIGIVSLRFTGVPTPKNVSLSYDSLLEVVTLSWNKCDSTLAASYNVYRRNVDSNTIFARINASPVSDTTFRDTTGVQDMTYEYVVTAVGPSGKEGLESAAVKVLIKNSFVLLKTIDVTKLSTSVVKAIATSDNKLLVLCRAPTSALFVLDSNYSVIDTIGAGLLSDPYDMAMDSAGELFVADYLSKQIFKFDAIGSLVSRWSTKASGSVVTIVDSTLIVGTTAGVEMFSLGGRSLASFPVNNPYVKGIAPSSDGNLFIYNNSTILKFSRLGSLLDSTYNIILGPSTTYNNQGYVVHLKQNILLFAFDKQLYAIDEQGNLISKATFAGVPGGIFVDQNRNTVLICDQNGRILEYQR